MATRTINSGGGADHTTISAWETYVNGLGSLTEDQIGEIQNAATYSEQVVFSGSTPNGNRIILTAAVGARHDGKDGAFASVRDSVGRVIEINHANVTIEHLVIEQQGTGGSWEGIRVASGGDNCVIDSVVCFPTTAGSSSQDGVYTGNWAVSNLEIKNSIFYDWGRGGINIQNYTGGNAQDVDIENCLCVDCGSGVIGWASGGVIDIEVNNTACLNNGTDFDVDGGVPTWSGSNNVSADATVDNTTGFGTPVYGDVTLTDNAALTTGEVYTVTNLTGNDFRSVQNTGGATDRMYEAGVTRGNITADIVDASRTAPYDIGPFEVSSGGGNPEASGSATTAPLTASGAATVTRVASGAANTPTLTASGAATAKKQSSGAANVPTLTASGAATARKQSSGAANTPKLTASGAATKKLSASGAATMASLIASGQGIVVRQSSGAANIPTLTATGQASVRKQASGAASIASLTGSGAAQFQGDNPSAGGNATMPPLTATGAATKTANANGAAIAAPLTASGAAALRKQASGAATMTPLTASGAAIVRRVASGAAQLPSLIGSGVASDNMTASGAAILPALTASGAATVRKSASGAAVMPTLTAAGAALRRLPASGAASIASLIASGSTFEGAIVRDIETLAGCFDVVETITGTFDLVEEISGTL